MITFEDLKSGRTKVGVVGLGYVGLPLAVALAAHYHVVGFDIHPKRIQELSQGVDRTAEVAAEELASVKIHYTSDPTDLARCGLIIVAVPTPIDEYRKPELGPVRGATATVGKHMSKGTVVVYESTVYPGLTEEICVPLLEQQSGLKGGSDFKVGYSPERVNPGDRVHNLQGIVKVVSGQDEQTLELLTQVYGTIVPAGIHKAPTIKTAEAAKVIENTQRDLNIALMNELSLIFERMGIDTQDVLKAAGTKWNFVPFSPGLVGGHCIGVDPYYLTFKAEALGYHPQVILAGRRINDYMASHVASITVKRLIRQNRRVGGARVGVLGLTFKENVPDLRNTKVVDVVRELEDYGIKVLVHDPMADPEEAMQEYGLALSPLEDLKDLSALILAVPHRQYDGLEPEEIKSRFMGAGPGLVVDVRGKLDPARVRAVGMDYWRL